MVNSSNFNKTHFHIDSIESLKRVVHFETISNNVMRSKKAQEAQKSNYYYHVRYVPFCG